MLRLGSILLALLGMAWVAVAVPREIPGIRIAAFGERTAHGDSYRPEVMAAIIDVLDQSDGRAGCRESYLVPAIFLRIRAAEAALAAADPALLDERLARAEAGARQLMKCSPYHALGWLAAYWVRTYRNGYDPADLRYLEMSYRLAPREAWAAARRNMTAMRLYEELPPAFQQQVLDEWADMLRSRLFDAAIEVFVGPGYKVRDQLLSRISGLRQEDLRYFAYRLDALGVPVQVPGLPVREDRPWR